MPPLPTKPSIGSTLPSVKYPVWLAVLQEIANGETPKRACEIHDTTLAALRYHLKQDEELKAMFDDALATGNDALADMLINIDQVHSAPAMAGVISKNIQWYLERRDPTKFGARVQVDMNNNATQKLIGALDAAIARIPMASAPVIEAKMITDVEVLEIVNPLPPGAQAKKEAVPASTPPQDVPLADLRLLGLLD